MTFRIVIHYWGFGAHSDVFKKNQQLVRAFDLEQTAPLNSAPRIVSPASIWEIMKPCRAQSWRAEVWLCCELSSTSRFDLQNWQKESVSAECELEAERNLRCHVFAYSLQQSFPTSEPGACKTVVQICCSVLGDRYLFKPKRGRQKE